MRKKEGLKKSSRAKKKSIHNYKYVTDLLNFVNDSVIMTDLNMRILDWNKEAEKIYGWKKQEVIGKYLKEVIPIKNFSSDRREIISEVKKHHSWKGEVIQLDRKGKEVFGNATVSYVKNENGKNAGYIAIVKDITEIRTTQERLELAQRAGSIGIFEVDLKSRKLWWSDSEIELLGLRKKQFTGDVSNFRSRVLPEDLPGVLEGIEEAVSGKRKEFEQEFRIIKKGEVRWIKGRGEVVYDKSNTPIRLLGANYDITDIKKLEEGLRYKSTASRVLSSSLNYKSTLKSLAYVSVPIIADWCEIDMITEENEIESIEVQRLNKKETQWIKKWRKRHPHTEEKFPGIWNVLRGEKTILIPYVTEESLKKNINDKKEINTLLEVGVKSMLIVPIKVLYKTSGVITFISAESKRVFSRVDKELAEQIATRTSLAIENAMLFQAVEEERERLKTILSNTPSIVWEVRFNEKLRVGEIIYISDYVEEMLGYTRSEAINDTKFWATIVHPEDLQMVRDEMAIIAKSGKSGVMRMRLITSDGRTIWGESRCNSIKDNTGKVIGLQGVTIDISDTVDAEERKDEFISLASHELKTPLTSLKVYTHLFSKKISTQGDQKIITSLEKMNNQINRLSDLINDLLDLSRIQAGKLLYRTEPTNFDEFIDETLDGMKKSTNSHSIVLKGKTSAIVEMDQNRINQVINNFVSNAIKYSPGKKKIVVSVKKNGNKVIFAVKDYGRGIAKKHQKRIFERFYQVDREENRTVSGLGIGLYICSEIIKKHQGEIGIESKIGKGTTFYFSLPITNTPLT